MNPDERAVLSELIDIMIGLYPEQADELTAFYWRECGCISADTAPTNPAAELAYWQQRGDSILAQRMRVYHQSEPCPAPTRPAATECIGLIGYWIDEWLNADNPTASADAAQMLGHFIDAQFTEE